jgi:hydrogenase maturation protease
MPRVVVIAVGNTLRSDDGLAWHVADELKRQGRENLRVLKVYQLTPELAEAVSEVDLAVFVDAGAQGDPGTLTCEPVTASASDFRFSHDVTPATLVRIAKTLYGKSPTAYMICVAGKSFEHGESLSPEVASAIPSAIAKVQDLMVRSVLPAR